jgi:uncharacterized protein (TIGR03067 family)
MDRRVFVGLFALTLLAAQPAGDAAKDLEKLQGAWKVESAEYGGMPLPADAVEKIRVTFKGTEVTIRDPKDPATFSLDPGQKPAAITLKPPQKPGGPKEAEIQGIYQFEGEKLKLCLNQPGMPRPTEFKSSKGGEVVLFVLAKEKAK